MTLPANNRNDYIGTGATPTYPFTFLIFAATDLRVIETDLAGVDTVHVLTTDYTVPDADVGKPSGGNITLVAGNLTTGHELSIRRVRPLTQGTDIRNQGDFLPENHEDAFDHHLMVDQQQQDEIDRSIKIPESVDPTTVDTDLPRPSALKGFRWNATEDALEEFDLASAGNFVLPGAGILVYNGATLNLLARTITGSGAVGVVDGNGLSGNPIVYLIASGVDTVHLNTGSVTKEKVNADLVGDGLQKAAAVDPISVKPDVTAGANIAPLSVSSAGVGVQLDNVTLKHTAGVVRVPTNGIGPLQINRTAIHDYASASGVVRVTTLPGSTNDTRAASTEMVQLALASASGARVAVEPTQQTIGDSVAETTIFSKSIVGNSIGTDGMLLFKAIIDAREDAGGAPTLTFRLKYGGSTIATIAGVGAGAGAHVAMAVSGVIANLNSASSQSGELKATDAIAQTTVVAEATAAVDSTVAKDLVLTAQWSGLPNQATSLRMKYAAAYVIR